MQRLLFPERKNTVQVRVAAHGRLHCADSVAASRLHYGCFSWRRDPESNWAKRICNPLHNRFAIAPNRARELYCANGAAPSSRQKNELTKFGAGDESRTRDLNLGKVALYQLSYSRVQQAGKFSS